MKKKILMIVVLTILVMSTTYYPIQAASDLQSQKNNLQQSWDDAKKQQKEVQGEKSEAEKKVQELNSEIAKNELELQNLKSQMASLEDEVSEKQIALNKAEEEYKEQDELLQKRIVAGYMAGKTTYLDVLLNSKGLTDFISNYYKISEITKYDTELLEQLQEKKKQIEESKSILDSKKTELKAAKAEAEKKNVVLKNNKAEQSKYLNQLSDKEKELQKKVKEYEDEMNRIEQQIADLSKGEGAGGNYTGGQFIWPLQGIGVGKNITSEYGYRYLELYGYTRLHAGIDIGAPKGTNVYAAAAGTVVLAGWNGGYGNCVMINHGGGLMTVYGHGSAVVASVGQKVNTGDVILKVGSTGNSTGNHLHFEVRKNGTAVPPRSYLGI